MQTDPCEPTCDAHPRVVDPAVAADGEYELRAGQREQAQQDIDLVAQPAARHEHEPLAPLRELIRELHGDAAAE